MHRLYNYALGLAILTILYNIAEGIFSTYLGLEDESLALFGFGADSFIEVLSGFGIALMVIRIRKNPDGKRSLIERTTLRITGTAFYLLVAVLVGSALFSFWSGHKPHNTVWGIVISTVSIVAMGFLVMGKRKIGRELQSAPILADANCTLVCLYMSLILLISSGSYHLFNIPYVDGIGTLGLAYFAFNEGRECFVKSKSDLHCSCH